MPEFNGAQFLDRVSLINEIAETLEEQGVLIRQLWDEYVQGDKTGRHRGEIRHGDNREYSTYDWEIRWDEQYYPDYIKVQGEHRRHGDRESYQIPYDFILHSEEWFERQPEENRVWQEEEDERIARLRVETERLATERRRAQYEALREEFESA